MGYALIWVEIHTFLLNSFFINLENYGEHVVNYVTFFSMEMNIYTINIKTTGVSIMTIMDVMGTKKVITKRKN